MRFKNKTIRIVASRGYASARNARLVRAKFRTNARELWVYKSNRVNLKHRQASRPSMYTPPVKELAPLPDLPRKSNMRTTCLRAGKAVEGFSQMCIALPPKKRDVHEPKCVRKKKVKFDVEISDSVDVLEYEIRREFRRNTSKWRRQDALVRKALHRGIWKKQKGLYKHIASGTMLLESGFLVVLESGMPWPPPQTTVPECKPEPPVASPPKARSPQPTAFASNPMRHL